MRKIVCDKCGKDITNVNPDDRYIVIATKEGEQTKQGCGKWKITKEVCMGCMLEIEQQFKY